MKQSWDLIVLTIGVLQHVLSLEVFWLQFPICHVESSVPLLSPRENLLCLGTAPVPFQRSREDPLGFPALSTSAYPAFCWELFLQAPQPHQRAQAQLQLLCSVKGMKALDSRSGGTGSLAHTCGFYQMCPLNHFLLNHKCSYTTDRPCFTWHLFDQQRQHE